MLNDENLADERGHSTASPGQQKESADEEKHTAPEHDAAHKSNADSSHEETQRQDQSISNDKKNRKRGSLGPEDWGGYKGY